MGGSSNLAAGIKTDRLAAPVNGDGDLFHWPVVGAAVCILVLAANAGQAGGGTSRNVC